jgi:hypothetical protein
MQYIFANPTVSLRALCNSCVKIACCSSELILAFVYAGISIQNVGQQFVWAVYLYFLNHVVHPTYKQKYMVVRAVDANDSLSLSVAIQN